MKRREFITLIGGAATWPLAARAQQPAGRVYRVGYLAGGSQQRQLYLIKAFDEGLRSLGYRVGQNIVIEYRFADGEHAWRAYGEKSVRMNVTVSPGGFEHFFFRNAPDPI